MTVKWALSGICIHTARDIHGNDRFPFIRIDLPDDICLFTGHLPGKSCPNQGINDDIGLIDIKFRFFSCFDMLNVHPHFFNHMEIHFRRLTHMVFISYNEDRHQSPRLIGIPGSHKSVASVISCTADDGNQFPFPAQFLLHQFNDGAACIFHEYRLRKTILFHGFPVQFS